MVSQAQGVMHGHKGVDVLAGCLALVQTKFEHRRKGNRAGTESYKPLDLAEGQEKPL